jgi:hypothetical protein
MAQHIYVLYKMKPKLSFPLFYYFLCILPWVFESNNSLKDAFYLTATSTNFFPNGGMIVYYYDLRY